MFRVGVDVGGTFTDLFAIGADGRRVIKVPTTSDDPAEGVFRALELAGLTMGQVEVFMHSTTVATNAVIERKGARCALVTTRGFRDVLELGRRDRPNMYGLSSEDFAPLIPRRWRFEVTERIDHRGRVLIPLDEDEVRRIGEVLLQNDVKSVVIAFLHADVNPSHEQRAAAILRSLGQGWVITTSSEVLPQFYEFERTSTAVVHGYVRPILERYGSRLERMLGGDGRRPSVFVMQSNGGVVPLASMGERAVHMIRSGPVAGVVAAAYLARLAGYDRVISGDMGGTSFDVGLILGGEPRITRSSLLGFRIPVAISMLDVRSIGAGGGSIAWFDRSGLLRVGPQSAGASPGPACYGRGGTEATVTDAHVVLGRINAERPVGTGLKLQPGNAVQSIRNRVAQRLGVSVEEAAEAVLQVVNSNMAGEIRLLTVDQGFDPRQFVLVAFGGAGPLHAASLLKETGIPRALVPSYPGLMCAIGCVVADLRFELVRSVNRTVDRLTEDELEGYVAELVERAEKRFKDWGVALEERYLRLTADMCYEGQVHSIEVRLPDSLTPERVATAFEEAYQAEYGAVMHGIPCELVTLRLSAVGVRERPDPRQFGMTPTGARSASPVAHRKVYFGGRWEETPVYDRSQLPEGFTLEGPAICEQVDTTVLIEPGTRAAVDRFGNLLVEVAGNA